MKPTNIDFLNILRTNTYAFLNIHLKEKNSYEFSRNNFVTLENSSQKILRCGSYTAKSGIFPAFCFKPKPPQVFMGNYVYACLPVASEYYHSQHSVFRHQPANPLASHRPPLPLHYSKYIKKKNLF